jgi:hypothetical protein
MAETSDGDVMTWEAWGGRKFIKPARWAFIIIEGRHVDRRFKSEVQQCSIDGMAE